MTHTKWARMKEHVHRVIVGGHLFRGPDGSSERVDSIEATQREQPSGGGGRWRYGDGHGEARH